MRTKTFFILPVLLVIISLVVFACTKDKTPEPPEPCDPNKVYFERDVQPLLIANCAMSGCHDAKTAQEGVNLTSYNGVVRVVKKGNPTGSDLIEVLTKTRGDKKMPPAPNPSLSAAQIAMLSRWILEGAQNNSCVDDTASCVVSSVSYSAVIQPLVASKCGNCHGNSIQKGGYNFSTYSGLKVAVANGKLYNSVAQNGQAIPMPEGGKLQACEIKSIKAWIDAGAQNN